MSAWKLVERALAPPPSGTVPAGHATTPWLCESTEAEIDALCTRTYPGGGAAPADDANAAAKPIVATTLDAISQRISSSSRESRTRQDHRTSRQPALASVPDIVA